MTPTETIWSYLAQKTPLILDLRDRLGLVILKHPDHRVIYEHAKRK